MEMFLASGYARLFEKGTPKYVSGMSGTELVCDILIRIENKKEFLPAQIEYSCSKEDWCGWILAYYQWYSGKYHFSEKYGEQGAKNINKAAASTLVMLAKTLNCEIEDLLE